MKKVFILLLFMSFIFCGCQSASEEAVGENCDVRPMMFYEGIYWKNPYIPVSELPEGYESAGTVSEEMAYNTGLDGIEFYTKEGSGDFYTYQMTGTFIGGNTVDTTKQAMHYVQWVPIESNE